MTGYQSKKAAAQDRMIDDDDTQGYIAQCKAAQPAQQLTLQEQLAGIQLATAQTDLDKANAAWGQANLVNGPYILEQPACNETLHAQGKAYPRTCKKCRLGPCAGCERPLCAAPRPLAAQPAQERTWVDLADDEEIADYLGDEYHTMTESDLRFFRFGVAAAKEKNNGT